MIEVSTAELLRAAMDARIANVHTALPGQVVSYDPATQTASVQPMIKRVYVDADGNEASDSLPQLLKVPVCFPRAGLTFITFPIQPGDGVLLVFAERPLDQWRTQGIEADPGDIAMHQLGDAIAIPGVFPTAQAIPVGDVSTVGIGIGRAGGPAVHITPTVVELGGSMAVPPTDFVALASLVSSALATLKTAISGAAVTPGDGGSAFKAAILAALTAWPPTLAATKVKAL